MPLSIQATTIMRFHRWQRAVVSISAIPVLAMCSPPRPAPGRAASGPVREEIIAIERQAWEAWKRKDGAFFRSTLLPNAAYVSGTGLSTREEIAKGMETDTCKVDGYILRNQEVHSVSSEVALLTYRAMSDVTCGDRSVHADAWSSTLYVRDGDSWKVSFHQETDAQR
jgi:Domain of unknown function (DUF4440)